MSDRLKDLGLKLAPVLAFERIYGTRCSPVLPNDEANWLVLEIETRDQKIKELEQQIESLQKQIEGHAAKRSRKKASHP